MSGKCFICGRYCSNTESHHIFGGPRRKKSEKFGLVVDLCHSCHNEPPNGAHFNAELMDELHKYGQRKAMEEQGWTIPDFIREFGKNYL